MNVQAVRLALERDLPGYFPGWAITLAAPTLTLNATKTVEIGHARRLVPDTFASHAVDLQIILWVNEANQIDAVNEMYLAISWDTGTAVKRLMEDNRVLAHTVESVGRRDEGPTGFLAADLTWNIQELNT